MKAEKIKIGTNCYVIPERVPENVNVAWTKDKKLKDLYIKQMRMPYTTPKLYDDHLFADGLFYSETEANKFIEENYEEK